MSKRVVAIRSVSPAGSLQHISVTFRRFQRSGFSRASSLVALHVKRAKNKDEKQRMNRTYKAAQVTQAGNLEGEGGSPTTRLSACDGLPVRNGGRPKTIIGSLHVQCNGHGDPKYLNQLLNDVLSWPHIESTPTSSNYLDKVSIRLQEIAATADSSAFINGTEFARVLLASPTIILALPLVCSH